MGCVHIFQDTIIAKKDLQDLFLAGVKGNVYETTKLLLKYLLDYISIA